MLKGTTKPIPPSKLLRNNSDKPVHKLTGHFFLIHKRR